MGKYLFPSVEEIMKRLQNANDTDGDVQRVFRRFAESMADNTKVAPGVVMGYSLAVYCVANQPMATPMITGMMHLLFEDVAIALFPDASEFAKECIEFHTVAMKASESE